MSFYPPPKISLNNTELKVELGTKLSPLALPTSFPGSLIFSRLPGPDERLWERSCGLPGHQLRSAIKMATAALSSLVLLSAFLSVF